MVVRPEMSNEQYKLLMISTGSGILLIASLLTSILTTGHSAGTFGTWMLVPFTVILWLFSAVRFAFGFRDGVTSVGLPLLVNSIIICLALLLYWINNRVEIGFRWRLSGYEDVVRLVELGELRPDENGFATLPKYYQWLSDGGEIVILQRENITSIIFYTQIEFPGEYYAFAYRSDDSIPTNFHDDRCDRGWRVQADIPNWYVCISAMVGIY